MIPPPNYAKRGRDLRLRSSSHLGYIRKRLCALWERGECQGKVQAAHLRQLAPEKGMGNKPSDVFTVGFCVRHHKASEKRERDFEKEYGIDLMALALEYGAASPDKRVKACALALLEVMKPDKFSADEIAEMVEQVMKKIREQER